MIHANARSARDWVHRSVPKQRALRKSCERAAAPPRKRSLRVIDESVIREDEIREGSDAPEGEESGELEEGGGDDVVWAGAMEQAVKGNQDQEGKDGSR